MNYTTDYTGKRVVAVGAPGSPSRNRIEQGPTLRLRFIVREEKHVRSTTDQRRRINYTIAEYIGDDGEIYRKAFESYGVPRVPESGTHATLNAAKIQWQADDVL